MPVTRILGGCFFSVQTDPKPGVAQGYCSMVGPIVGSMLLSLPAAQDPLTHRPGPWRGHSPVVAHPLGVRLLHCGALHVLPSREDCLSCGQVVGAHG